MDQVKTAGSCVDSYSISDRFISAYSRCSNCTSAMILYKIYILLNPADGVWDLQQMFTLSSKLDLGGIQVNRSRGKNPRCFRLEWMFGSVNLQADKKNLYLL